MNVKYTKRLFLPALLLAILLAFTIALGFALANFLF